MKLYHFSSTLPATGGTVDPKRLGQNSFTTAEKRALSIPRSFFYTHPKHREALFTKESPLFSADVPDDKVYDFDEDKHSIKQPGTTLSHMIAKVLRKGYHGVKYFDGKVVAMFKPVKVVPHKGRVKFARVPKHVFAWITPAGEVHHVPNLHLHVDVARKHGFKDIAHAQQNGWMRVAPGADGTLDGLNHVTSPNRNQLRALKDLAIGAGYDQASVNDRPLRLARSLVYVSPSMREGSTMAQALASFKSPEHAALNAEAQRLGGDPVPAMGTWTDGAEESSVVKAPSGRARIIAALLGKKFQQKAVGLFTPGPGGDTLHLVYLKGHTPESADAKLRQHGIEYATHVPVKNGVITHLIGAPEASVAALGAPFRKITGTAEFPGADTREAATRVYDEMLKMARELPEPTGDVRTGNNSHIATFESGDNTYTARMVPFYPGSPNHVFDFSQHDTPDEYGITGAGNAMQTFSHVAAHFIHGLRTLKPKRVYFSAEEPSRIKLYAALVKRLPKYAPEYVAHPSTVKGGWFVEPKEDPEVQLARPQPFSEVTKALLPQAGDPDARGILADHLEELGDPLYHVFRGEERPYGHTRGRQVFNGRTNNMFFALYRIPGDSKNIAASVNYGPDETGWHHTHVPVEAAKDIVRHHFGNVVSKDTTATAREMRARMGMDYPSYKKTKADQVREVMKLARDYDPEAPHPAEGWIEEDGTHHANEPGVYGDRHLRTLHRLGYKNHGEAVRAGLMHVAADDGQLLGHRSDRKYTAPQLITLKKLAAKNKTEPAITTTQNGIVTTRTLKMARSKAPSGGMIVNNQFYEGGKFLPRVFQSIKRVRAAKKAMVKLARIQLPEGAFKLKSLSDAQIRQIEDHHGLFDDERLPRTILPDGSVEAKIEHVAPFFDKLTKKAIGPEKHRQILADPGVADDVKFYHLLTHSHDSAKDYLDAVKTSGAEWYGSSVAQLDRGLKHFFGREVPGDPTSKPDPKKWTPHHNRLFKLLLALTSYNTSPVPNTKNAAHALLAGYRHNPDRPFENIPEANYEALAPYQSLPKPGVDLASRLAWEKQYGQKEPGYMSAPVRLSPDGRVVGVVTVSDGVKWTTPGFTMATTKPGRIPLTDAEGNLRPKTWGSMPPDRVRKFKEFLHKAGGDYRKAAKLLSATYTPAQLKALFGLKTVDRGDLDPDEKIPGSYAFGPKFGAFYQNLTGDKSRVTQDKWFTRTMARLVGNLYPGGKITEVPEGPVARRLYKRVAEATAAKLGMAPADLQALLWSYEQNLWRLFGAQNRSEDFKDGIRKLLVDKGFGDKMLDRKAKVPHVNHA